MKKFAFIMAFMTIFFISCTNNADSQGSVTDKSPTNISPNDEASGATSGDTAKGDEAGQDKQEPTNTDKKDDANSLKDEDKIYKD